MKSYHLYFIIISLSVPLFFSTSWATNSPNKAENAKSYSLKLPQKPVRPEIKIDKGYCCTGGNIIVTNEKQCKVRNGRYFADESKVKRECKGACCINGSIEKMNAKSCQAKRGTYYGTVKEAQQKCVGFCCQFGVISKTTQQVCKKRKGTYYKDKRSAEKQCQGYCCSEFDVSESTEQQCTSEKGRFFSNEPEADKYCKNKKGYCCINGKTTSLSQAQCTARNGTFYPTRNQAAANCKANRGYCNSNGKTIRLTEGKCEKIKGQYFSSQILAHKNLLKSLKKKSGKKTEANGPSPEIAPALATGSVMVREQKTEQPTERFPKETLTISQKFFHLGFGFIHPSAGEEFTQIQPRFTWRPHPNANKYFIRIMETGRGAGSHRTIWSKGNITSLGITFNSDGNASESLVPGTEYRANLYARLSSHVATPNNNPDDYIQMTGDVIFTVSLPTFGKGWGQLQGNVSQKPTLPLQIDSSNNKVLESAPTKKPSSTGIVPVPLKVDVGEMVPKSYENGYSLHVHPPGEIYTFQYDWDDWIELLVGYTLNQDVLPNPPPRLLLKLHNPSNHLLSTQTTLRGAIPSVEINTTNNPSGRETIKIATLPIFIYPVEIPDWTIRLIDPTTEEILAETDSFSLTIEGSRDSQGGFEGLEDAITYPTQGTKTPINLPVTLKLDQRFSTLFPTVSVAVTGGPIYNEVVYFGEYPGIEGIPIWIAEPQLDEYYFITVSFFEEGDDDNIPEASVTSGVFSLVESTPGLEGSGEFFVQPLYVSLSPKINSVTCSSDDSGHCVTSGTEDGSGEIVKVKGQFMGDERGSVRVSWVGDSRRRSVTVPTILWTKDEVHFSLPILQDVDGEESINLFMETADGTAFHLFSSITYQPPWTNKYLCAGGFRHWNEVEHLGKYDWDYNLRNGWNIHDSGIEKSGGWGNRCRRTGNTPRGGDTFIPTMLTVIDPRMGHSGGCVAWVKLFGYEGVYSGISSSETLYDDLETCKNATGFH